MVTRRVVSIPRCSIRFTINAVDDIVPVERRRYHRCNIVEAVIAPGVRLEIPCFVCSGRASLAGYLRSVRLFLTIHFQTAYFPELPQAHAEELAAAFIRSVVLPAHAYHRCPAPVSLFARVRLATLHLDFLPLTTPASDAAVMELIVAKAEEEVREGALFGRGWTGAGHDCVICMDEITHPGMALKMPCRHAFHHSCLLRWLQINHVCPLCHHPIPTHDY